MFDAAASCASVRRVKRPLLFLCTLASTSTLLCACFAGLLGACTDNGSATGSEPTAPPASDAGKDARGPVDPEDDAATPQEDSSLPQGATTCERTRQYQTACAALEPDAGDPLNCGAAKFDAWCAVNDQKINSDAFRRAETTCLTTPANCDGNARRDCEYRSYASATPTAAQLAVVDGYCRMCEPADVAGCKARKVAYDPSKGPKSVDDVFTAAWELSDALTDEIRTTCIAGKDGGASPAACYSVFSNCAGGVYVDRLPDCPQ
ncbi:MAG: hypothetical protein JWP97_3150 [Labilithrix sp.]|nr:hypothetical protein [Labilithrix sp.]